MYLFYIDESGNTGSNLDGGDQPVHWLVALGVTLPVLRRIELEMLELALARFPARAREPGFEFHGNHVFQGDGECRGMPPAERVALYGELLDVVCRNPCHVFVCGIDKQKHRARAERRGYPPAHPHRLGFMYMVERIDGWLAARSRREPCYGLLVADEQKEVDRDIIRSFALWRELGTDYGQRSREVRFLVDTVHYVPSHDSRLIQLADCLAYVCNRYAKVLREKGKDAAAHSPAEQTVVRLWEEKCLPRVTSQYLWP